MSEAVRHVPGDGPGSRPVAAVIYNPVKIDRDRLDHLIAAEASQAGWGETLWFETSPEDPGGGAAGRALAAGASTVIAAGGDGTVRAVAGQLGGTGIPLSLLPAGTGNLLARNLNLTLDDVEHAVQTAFTGADKRIDLGMVRLRRADNSEDEHAFVVMAGLGLDAKMLANTDEDLKHRIGWPAYAAAVITALQDQNRLHMRYRVGDGRARSLRAHTVIIGNCGTLQANVTLLPEAAVDDGLLDVLLLRPEGVFGWIQIVAKIVWENGILRRTKLGRTMMGGGIQALNYIRDGEFTVALGRPENVQLDGDTFGQARALQTWVEPEGITIRVPAEHARR